MLDLKPYYDAAIIADAEVQRIVNEIDAAFGEGTDEGKDKALALRPALDEAQVKAKAANDLYVSMRGATQASNVERNFVPVSETPTDPDGDKPKGVMKRTDWNALAPIDRAAFFKGGGKLED